MTRTALVAALALFPACVVGHVGSGDAVTVDREVDGAVAFSNETMVAVLVRPTADASGMEIRCDDNLVDELITEIEDDGMLRLRTPSGVNLLPRTDCTAIVELPRVDELAVSGSGEIRVEGDAPDLVSIRSAGSGRLHIEGASPLVSEISSSGSGAVEARGIAACELDVDKSGSGRVELFDLAVCDLAIRSSGSGRVVATGAAEHLELDLSGSGGLREPDLTVDHAVIDMSGSGGVELTVVESIEINMSGSGGATIHGSPEGRQVRATGSGKVRFEE